MRMKIKKRLNECFDDPYTSGIFKALDTLVMPWSEDQQPEPLDMVYMDTHSGEKLAAPIITNKLDDTGVLPVLAVGSIAGCIKAIYYAKWAALWAAFKLEYNPIENYNMTESGTDTTTKTGTDTNLKTGSTDHSGALTRTGSVDHSGALTRTGSLDHSGALTKTGSLDHSGALTKTGSESDLGDVTRTGKETDTDEFTSVGEKVVDDVLTPTGKEKTTDSLLYLGKEKDSGTQANNEQVSDASIYGYNSSTAQPTTHNTDKASHENIKEFLDDREDKHTITKEFLDSRKDSRTITESHSQDFKDTTEKAHEYLNVKDHTDTTHTYTNVAETDTRKETYNNIADTDTRKETYNNIADTDTRKETYNNVADTDTRKETYNNITDRLTHDTEDETVHSLERSGNIGVTTTQQMLMQEIELRKWNFFSSVMDDIDSLLTLGIY